MQSLVSRPFRTGITRRTLLCAATASLFALAFTLSTYSTCRTVRSDRDPPQHGSNSHHPSACNPEKVLAIRASDVGSGQHSRISILKPLHFFSAALQQKPRHTHNYRLLPPRHPHRQPVLSLYTPAIQRLRLRRRRLCLLLQYMVCPSLALRFTPLHLAGLSARSAFTSAITPESPPRAKATPGPRSRGHHNASPSQIATAYRILGNQLCQRFAKACCRRLARLRILFGMAHNADRV